METSFDMLTSEEGVHAIPKAISYLYLPIGNLSLIGGGPLLSVLMYRMRALKLSMLSEDTGNVSHNLSTSTGIRTMSHL